MLNFIKRQPAARIIAFGFLMVILIGSALLMLPFAIKDGVKLNYIDALYTSTSAVCVTGLIAVDAGDTFTGFGQAVIATLIQIGGLGVTTIGAGVIILLGKKINLKGRTLIREGSNYTSLKGTVKLIRDIFITTIIFETIGAILSFIVFAQDYPISQAIAISIFHSIAAFNNSGFDILGNYQNLIPYQTDILLNLVTCFLIIFGGLGFLVIREVLSKRFKWRKFSMHTKVVLVVTLFLLTSGTILIKVSEQNISWLGAFFFSVSARTAGFSTYSLATFRSASLLIIIILMFIGASPGSTGGGIKTTTLFVLFQGIKSAATNKQEKAFKYSVPKDAFKKAAVITLLALFLVITSTYLIMMLDPNVAFIDALFEMTSAFGTVGLSTGITPNLSIGSKIISILMMYIGRLGPLTIATLWYFSRGENIKYPDGNIAIG